MAETYTLKDALMGGPGLDGYAYQADVYCAACGEKVARKIFDACPAMDWGRFCDSEQVPQPIFFGEADSEQHCADCGEYLYGTDEAEEA
jgi:ribosomal protein S27E